jgi:hypothetical protein
MLNRHSRQHRCDLVADTTCYLGGYGIIGVTDGRLRSISCNREWRWTHFGVLSDRL